jgi:molybdopterin molybdotransferase
MRGFQDRTELADAQALVMGRVAPLSGERVELRAATGRVLIQDIVADAWVPAFDRAAMDGYALRGAETFGAGPYNPFELRVVGAAMPARPFSGLLSPGQAVRIMTGAPMPGAADAVLPAEHADEAESPGGPSVRVLEAVPPGRHVSRRGEDVQPGTRVLPAGRRLRPQDVGVLASLGVAAVSTVRRPKVTILVTGDELLPCGSRPESYRVVDSNSIMLDALVRRDGGEPSSAPIVTDSHDAVRSAMLAAEGDVLLVSGGSSVGQEDHAPRVLAELGELPVHGLALRPASPSGLGFLGARPVFLLPGNPVSCLCAYDLLAGGVIRRLGGLPPDLPYQTRTLRAARKIASAVGRVDYVRVAIEEAGVEPLATAGASVLTSTTRAAGFVLVPRDSEGFAGGASVLVYLYD